MSKRFFPEHQGDRKRARLDISISDHNFPLSQNNDENKEADTWGDDNDDEILLLASQACEQAYSNDISLLPDYSSCMQPGSTSTQLNPIPSTSKTEFMFKKPTANPPSIITTQLKEKCNRISSPLHGITSKVIPKLNGHTDLSDDDFMFSDKIFKEQDPNHIYRQLLQLQEENAKLKSENGKLSEKCVTKEGEASILRTQLKSCQVSVDNARMDKIKAQEKVQVEWTDKLATANNQMRDLRTQLDFKNLEIISIKEKCKKLESTKVRLTQVTVANNDISASHRQSSSFHNESMTQSRRVKTSSNAVQTDDKAQFINLNKTISKDHSPLTSLLPLILEPSPEHHSLVQYNVKLSRGRLSAAHSASTAPSVAVSGVSEKRRLRPLQLTELNGDFTSIAAGKADKERYFNVFNAASSMICEMISRLETIAARASSAFQKEMDEKYLDSTSHFHDVSKEDLLRGRPLYEEEQEIPARRLLAALACVAATPRGGELFLGWAPRTPRTPRPRAFFASVRDLCAAVDTASCATLYSGLFLSIIMMLRTQPYEGDSMQIVKIIIASRPMLFVIAEIPAMLTSGPAVDTYLCNSSGSGNLKTDYDQGVLLYTTNCSVVNDGSSCHFQILLRQVEACLKCLASRALTARAADVTRQLLRLRGLHSHGRSLLDKDRCRQDECRLVLVQVIVYALSICAGMLTTSKNECSQAGVVPLCRGGLQALHQWALREPELSAAAALAHNEGHLTRFCDLMRTLPHDEAHANMLAELTGTLQSSPEDMPPSFHRLPWVKSFEHFSIAD